MTPEEYTMPSYKLSYKHIFSIPFIAGGVMLSSLSYAVAPGGPNCGWGNMLFEGDSGKFAHFGANLLNGSSSNRYIGLLFGTNGCDTSEALTYEGQSLFAITGFIDEVAVDIAKGEGEALDALSIVMGIQQSDRANFNKLLHNNFNAIFPHENMQTQDVLNSIESVLQADPHFKNYVS